MLAPSSVRPSLATLNKIEHGYSLRHDLDAAWAVRLLAFSEQRGRRCWCSKILVAVSARNLCRDRWRPRNSCASPSASQPSAACTEDGGFTKTSSRAMR